MTSVTQSALLRALPYVAFFLSGASSLIFQALWTRMLHHTFGATSVAMSSVLTAFMAGLGFGAYLFGKHAARFRRPLAVYAAAELGVAACALVIPALVRSDGFFALVNAALRQTLGEGSFGFMVARFFCVLPLLLVPTTLMGGTLPLLAQHFVARSTDERASARVGTLYALNTFGAVAGTVLSSFVLMPAIGVRATNFVAVGINAALGLAILALPKLVRGQARSSERKPAPREAEDPAAQAEVDSAAAGQSDEAARERGESTPSAGKTNAVHAPSSAHERAATRRLALIAFGVSGACSMAYEVVWSRALAMAIGSSLQSFALILITFLIGIAGGSAAASHLMGAARSGGVIWLSFVSALLSLLALAPAIVLSNAALALSALGFVLAALFVHAQRALVRARDQAWAEEERVHAATQRELVRAGLLSLLVPCALALLELARFALSGRGLAAVTQHGYLPYITAAAVLCCAGFFALLALLRNAPLVLAGAVQLMIALATFVSYAFQDEIPYSFARLVTALRDLPSHVGTVRFFMLLAAGLCTLPATLGMGAMFPVTLELAARERAIGDDVGRVYAANTVGSILGAWLPGFVLLPLWGMERTLALGMFLNLVLALALLRRARNAPRPWRVRALASGAALMLLALVVHVALPRSPLAWNLSHMTLGAFRVSLAHEVLDPESWGQPDLVYYRDGVSTTVSVERWGRHLSLKNNGKVDASNGDDMPTQIMVAAYPLLLHPRGPKDLEVAIVGFGSGVTVGAALEFPVRHIDAMELEGAVVEAALGFFSDVSHLKQTRARFPYLEYPRLTLYNDDGRNFLAATNKRYDVIISEPSNPWITGVSDLFTIDHFRVTKQKLKPGGVYCQWVQLYELSPENIKTVYATFASQFEHVLAFSAEELSSDTILVGSDSPLPIDVAHVARSLADPRVANELERAYVHSPYDVWSRILFASRAELQQFAQTEWRREGETMKEVMRATGAEPCRAPNCVREPVELNSDDNMLIELRAPSDLIGFSRYDGYLQLFYGASWPYGELPRFLLHVDGPQQRLQMALSLLAHGRKPWARTFARMNAPSSEAARSPEQRIDARTIALLLGDEPEPLVELEPPLPSLPLSDTQRSAFQRAYDEAEQAYARGQYTRAVQALERLPAPLRTLSGPSLRFRYALALLRASGGDLRRTKQAVLELEELIRRDQTYTSVHPELYYFLARALDEARSYDKAVRNMRAYAELTLLP